MNLQSYIKMSGEMEIDALLFQMSLMSFMFRIIMRELHYIDYLNLKM